MGLEVKRAVYLHTRKGLDAASFFSLLVRIAGHDGVEPVMALLPREYHAPFRDWVRGLPLLEILIDIEAGPIGESEQLTIRAIGDWLDRHANADGSGDRSEMTASGSSGR